MAIHKNSTSGVSDGFQNRQFATAPKTEDPMVIVGNPPYNGNGKVAQIRLSATDYASVKQIAEAKGLSISGWVRMLIKDYLHDQGASK